MKVIFLDIDGVLNCATTKERWRGVIGMEPEKVAIINTVIQITGAMVVLSSSWRHDPDWKKTMQENGLDTDKFIGRTPSSDNGFRGDEIEQWLTDNADRDVESYVIVDDDSDFTPWQIKNHFVKTTWEEGLTPEKAGEMVEKLLKD